MSRRGTDWPAADEGGNGRSWQGRPSSLVFAPATIATRTAGDPLRLSDSEVHFLWWFIQGSIMNGDTRRALRRSWGLCERHAWASLSVDMAFRHRYLLGPSILYKDLLERALDSFGARIWPARPRLALNLRSRGRCLLCDMKLSDAPGCAAPRESLDKGRNIAELASLAKETEARWRPYACGPCSGRDTRAWCRRHFLADLRHLRWADIMLQRRRLDRTLALLDRLERSFLGSYRCANLAEEYAALIIAVGWCSGWAPLLAMVSRSS